MVEFSFLLLLVVVQLYHILKIRLPTAMAYMPLYFNFRKNRVPNSTTSTVATDKSIKFNSSSQQRSFTAERSMCSLSGLLW
jgi:hypothetical protein